MQPQRPDQAGRDGLSERDGLSDRDGLRDRLLEVIDDVIASERMADSRKLEVQVSQAASPSDPLAATRIFLRPLANPLSLGFLGLFLATMILAAIELGWIPLAQTDMLVVGILAFTVPAQLIACVYGFLCRDLVAATGMGVLAGFWSMVAIITLLSKPGAISPALGYLLVMGAAALCMPAIAAANNKVLAGAVMFTTVARWSATAGYEFDGSSLNKTIAGAIGLLLAVLALYASLAFELEDQHRRIVLPTIRRKLGRVAIEGDLGHQVEKASNEAGVRRSL